MCVRVRAYIAAAANDDDVTRTISMQPNLVQTVSDEVTMAHP